jgi:hypothetical protein
MHFVINYRWDLLHNSLCPPTARICFTICLQYVHLPQGIASTEASPPCPPTAGNCFNGHISYMSTYRWDCFNGHISYMSTYRWELLQRTHLLHVHLKLGIASTEASPTCPPTAGNDGGIRSEEAEQTQGSRLLPLHVHLPQGIASQHVHLPLGMTEGSVLKSRSRHRAVDWFHYMSTYRRELLASPTFLHVHLPLGIATTCPPTAGNDGGIRSEESEQTQGSRLLPLHVHLPQGIASQHVHLPLGIASQHVHLPLGMTEGSVLKRRSRHRAADCFHYMSTYHWELLHNNHLLCPPTAGNDGGIRSEEPK